MLCFGMMYQIKAIFYGGRASLWNKRTFIDREWLLIDFDSDSVSEYTIMMD